VSSIANACLRDYPAKFTQSDTHFTSDAHLLLQLHEISAGFGMFPDAAVDCIEARPEAGTALIRQKHQEMTCMMHGISARLLPRKWYVLKTFVLPGFA
jgi:hypothetical protein